MKKKVLKSISIVALFAISMFVNASASSDKKPINDGEVKISSCSEKKAIRQGISIDVTENLTYATLEDLEIKINGRTDLQYNDLEAGVVYNIKASALGRNSSGTGVVLFCHVMPSSVTLKPGETRNIRVIISD